MNISIITRRMDRLSSDTIYKKLWYMTNQQTTSHMRQVIRETDGHDSELAKLVAIIAKSDSEYLGWALLRPNYGHMMFFVMKEHRRKGIGTKLYLHSEKYIKRNWTNKHLYASAWDTASTEFFASLGFIDSGSIFYFDHYKKIRNE